MLSEFKKIKTGVHAASRAKKSPPPHTHTHKDCNYVDTDASNMDRRE